MPVILPKPRFSWRNNSRRVAIY